MTVASSATARTLIALRSGGEGLLWLLLFLALPFFFVSASWFSDNSGQYLINLGHAPFFALLTYLVNSRVRLDRPRRWLTCSLAILAFSVLIEFIQSKVGRSADWRDVLRNLLGCWLILFWLRNSGSVLTWAGRILTAGLLLADIAIALNMAFSQYQLNARLPTLADFENSGDGEQWVAIASELSRSDEAASQGKFALKGQLSSAPFSGISLSRMPGDWSHYAWLDFDLYNPDPEELKMTLRIHDARHESGDRRWQYGDRFNRRLTLESGWNHYRIQLKTVEEAPENRELDLRSVKNLSLFAAGLSEPKVIFADNFRLEM